MCVCECVWVRVCKCIQNISDSHKQKNIIDTCNVREKINFFLLSRLVQVVPIKDRNEASVCSSKFSRSAEEGQTSLQDLTTFAFTSVILFLARVFLCFCVFVQQE